MLVANRYDTFTDSDIAYGNTRSNRFSYDRERGFDDRLATARFEEDRFGDVRRLAFLAKEIGLERVVAVVCAGAGDKGNLVVESFHGAPSLIEEIGVDDA